MSYITTFDVTFFALWAYYAVSVGISALIYRRLRTASPGRVRQAHIAINALWVIVLLAAAYFGLHGTTTFLFVCVIIGTVLGVVTYIRNERRMQRELLDDLRGHMVDTLPTALK